jgi:hypothetical protein
MAEPSNPLRTSQSNSKKSLLEAISDFVMPGIPAPSNPETVRKTKEVSGEVLLKRTNSEARIILLKVVNESKQDIEFEFYQGTAEDYNKPERNRFFTDVIQAQSSSPEGNNYRTSRINYAKLTQAIFFRIVVATESNKAKELKEYTEFKFSVAHSICTVKYCDSVNESERMKIEYSNSTLAAP